MNLEDLKQIIGQKRAVLLYFYSDRCPPCKSLRPKVEALISTDFPSIQLIYINGDESMDLAGEFMVFAHPTLLVFFEGKEHIRESKYVAIEELKTKIKRPYSLVFD